MSSPERWPRSETDGRMSWMATRRIQGAASLGTLTPQRYEWRPGTRTDMRAMRAKRTPEKPAAQAQNCCVERRKGLLTASQASET